MIVIIVALSASIMIVNYNRGDEIKHILNNIRRTEQEFLQYKKDMIWIINEKSGVQNHTQVDIFRWGHKIE